VKAGTAHIAEFRIYSYEAHRNLALGTILTKTFIEVAQESRIEIIQLSAFSNNKLAMHVCRKCGFKKCGKLTRDTKFTDGTYADRINNGAAFIALSFAWFLRFQR
jgi:RimJ/RimL family protein N-acetyltransferase